jgi:putative hydrolase of the HAD superfamily
VTLRINRQTVWLFDLDNTLHDAGVHVFGALHQAMGDYTAQALQIDGEQARKLNHHYWQRYGATLLGLMRHHGVQPAHFLHQTHLLPGLEPLLSGHRADFAALRRLPGRKLILTNAPRAYALRVVAALGIADAFDALIAIDDMRMFGQLRPKPDARMLRAVAVQLGVPASRCVLVEDTLAHQKAARKIGMGTVWMQRFLRRRSAPEPVFARWTVQPAYVDRTVRSLRVLSTLIG